MKGGVVHRTRSLNGINMHIAEKGQGPPVLLLHGFPEFWFSWRNQMDALAAAGYRAVAPDLRGYGDTTGAPLTTASEYTCLHVVGDVVALIDSLQAPLPAARSTASESEASGSVYVVGHDWGAIIGWYLCLFRPDRVRAYVSLSIPFRPRNPAAKPVETLRKYLGDDYYMCRFQRHGEIESEIEPFGAEAVLRKIFASRQQGPPILPPKGNPFGIDLQKPDPLPPWLSQQDLCCYAQTYDRNGFTGPLNYYRALDSNWELTAAWTGAQVKVPAKFIVGDLDQYYTTPGVKEYIHNGDFKKDVPLLEEIVVIQGAGHFIQQERADEINTHISDFFNKY